MIHIELQPEQRPAQNWFDLVQEYDTALKNRTTNFTVTTPTGKKPEIVDLSTKNGRERFFARLKQRSDTRENLWRDDTINLKNIFFQNENIVGDKCWLSETSSVGAPLEIEHFRPKGEVDKLDYLLYNIFDENTWRILGSLLDIQSKRDEGYYWLTYDWQNYRLSCKDSNTRKGTYFPLLPNSVPATLNGEETNEIPVLIDPLIKDDVELICFEQINEDEVKVVPSTALPIINGVNNEEEISETDKINYFRAVVSIWVYNLNDMRGIKKARGTVWNDTERLLRRVSLATPIDDNVFVEIKGKTHKNCPHCGVARQVVRQFFDSGRITEEQYLNCFNNPVIL